MVRGYGGTPAFRAAQLGEVRLRQPPQCAAYSPNSLRRGGHRPDIQVLDMKNHKRLFKFSKHRSRYQHLRVSRRRRVLSGMSRTFAAVEPENANDSLAPRHKGSVFGDRLFAQRRFAVTGGRWLRALLDLDTATI